MAQPKETRTSGNSCALSCHILIASQLSLTARSSDTCENRFPHLLAMAWSHAKVRLSQMRRCWRCWFQYSCQTPLICYPG